MPRLDDSFPPLRLALHERYGRPGAVPQAQPFLAAAAAVLAGDAVPGAIDAARRALHDGGLCDAPALAAADPATVEDALRDGPLRLNRKAAAALVRLARWLAGQHGGDDASLADRAAETLREELSAINGIGRATADRLLLYALHRPVYPLDRATYRVFARHGWIEPSAEYDEARTAVERSLADDPDELAGFAALMERVGREFCRAAAPRCERCPLRPWLPESGPVDPTA
jgi:endonuclease-3 related protein